GRLGTGTNADRREPQAVRARIGDVMGVPADAMHAPIAPGVDDSVELNRVVEIAAGDDHSLARLADGSIDPSPLVHGEFPLSRAAEAVAEAGRPGVLKVLVRPDSAGPHPGA
ncbi:hypothetical protein K8I85_17325, partial [bacterium]|nr:hypothetical protein [bacterium]